MDDDERVEVIWGGAGGGGRTCWVELGPPGLEGEGVGAWVLGAGVAAGVVSTLPFTCATLELAFEEDESPIRRNPACIRKSHTRLVLFTSILTRSLASRLLNFPPRLAYSRTSVSLMTRYGFGRMRSCEQSVCSSGVSRCSDGLFARFSGAAGRAC